MGTEDYVVTRETALFAKDRMRGGATSQGDLPPPSGALISPESRRIEVGRESHAAHAHSGLLALVMLGLTRSIALATSVHPKATQRRASFPDGGLTLNATGRWEDLAKVDVHVAMSAQAEVTTACTNLAWRARVQPPAGAGV